jgi:hypothetical protein
VATRKTRSRHSARLLDFEAVVGSELAKPVGEPAFYGAHSLRGVIDHAEIGVYEEDRILRVAGAS